ncbi:MAG: zinc ribbon domain-containing protein [Chloroflexota bacterium]|nr:zinc ribbon domain-containing protein [Chloroflexota bacterium]
MLKRIALLAILGVLSLGIASPARAEEPLRISSLDVSVWPEYDQPGVLVQYQGGLTAKADKTNPLELSFFVPKGAGVGAACAIQSNGNHTSETWKESDADNGLTKITFKVTEPQFHVEYYYNPLTGSPDKKMSFAYAAAMPADEVDLAIQHPLKATNFVLTPDAPNSHQDQDGFTYHAYAFKNVAVGQKLSTEVAYTKTDPKPSVSGDQKPASSTNATNSATDNGINPNQVIVLATVLAMAGIVAFFVWQRNTQRAQPRYANAETYRAAPRAGAAAPAGFCTQCGNAMAVGDKFCARCGSRMADIQ